MLQGISFHSLAPKREKDNLYNSRPELLTSKFPEADTLVL